jgi:hypothetical protein
VLMKKFTAFLLFLAASLAFAIPAPQQITIELGKSFTLQGLDRATFEDMNFYIESVSMTGENAQVMIALTLGESEETETLMLELPAAASIEVGEYTLTLQGATVPEEPDMPCSVSTVTLVLEKTEADL